MELRNLEVGDTVRLEGSMVTEVIQFVDVNGYYTGSGWYISSWSWSGVWGTAWDVKTSACLGRAQRVSP